MVMTYTICEICGTEQYCLLQLNPNASEDESVIIKRAVCLHCLKYVYEQTLRNCSKDNLS